METKLLNPLEDKNAIQKAAQFILQGEVVGMPTETVYGLAANALDAKAVEKIFIAKGRPQDNPLIVHISDITDIEKLCVDIPEIAYIIAEKFWPGPITMILKKKSIVPDVTSANLDTIGIRLPSHKLARELIRKAGVPLAAPSANTSGRPSTTTANHVMNDMNGKIPAVIDGDSCGVGLESTIISLVGKPRLLRPGGITLEQLQEVVGDIEVDKALYESISNEEKVSAPGMKYKHYAPKAQVFIVQGENNLVAQYINQNSDENTGVLCFDDVKGMITCSNIKCFGNSNDLETQAQLIFDKLREFDETNVIKIFAQCPSDDGLGLAIANRLKKAAGFCVINIG